jgi:hypothetical protein
MAIETNSPYIKNIISQYLSDDPPPIYKKALVYPQGKFTVFIGLAMSDLQFNAEMLGLLLGAEKLPLIRDALEISEDEQYPMVSCKINKDNSVIFYRVDAPFVEMCIDDISTLTPDAIATFIDVCAEPELYPISDETDISIEDKKKVIQYLSDAVDRIFYKNPNENKITYSTNTNSNTELRNNYIENLLDSISLHTPKNIYQIIYDKPFLKENNDFRTDFTTFEEKSFYEFCKDFKLGEQTIRSYVNDYGFCTFSKVNENGKMIDCIDTNMITEDKLHSFIIKNQNIEELLKIKPPVLISSFLYNPDKIKNLSNDEITSENTIKEKEDFSSLRNNNSNAKKDTINPQTIVKKSEEHSVPVSQKGSITTLRKFIDQLGEIKPEIITEPDIIIKSNPNYSFSDDVFNNIPVVDIEVSDNTNLTNTDNLDDPFDL